MSTRKPQSHDETQKDDYPMPVFYASFGIIFLLATVLITSPVWESLAPSWIEETIKNKSRFLAMSAAMTMLLALILTIRPAGLAKYAAVGSGLLSFASAISFDIAELTTALVMLAFMSPIYIFALCQLVRAGENVHWVSFCALVFYCSISIMVMLLTVPVLRNDLANSIIKGVIDSAESLILFSLALSVVFGFLLTVAITCIILVCIKLLYRLKKLFSPALKDFHWKPRRNRAERRRASRNR